MPYQNSYPSNQAAGAKPASDGKTPQVPLARIQTKPINTGAIGEGFQRMGRDIVQQQLPGFFHKVLHSIVDVFFPGSYSPYIARSNYSGYPTTGYPPQYGRMAQPPAYGGQRLPNGYASPQPVVADIMPQRKSFDSFILPSSEAADEIFRALMSDASQLGYLTVSQVYDRLRLPVSYMGVSYYWTMDDISTAEIMELPSGECRVKMPKAHLTA